MTRLSGLGGALLESAVRVAQRVAVDGVLDRRALLGVLEAGGFLGLFGLEISLSVTGWRDE